MLIYKADNGYILQGSDGKQVFEDNYTEKAHCECVQRLLYAVLEELGEYGSKHDAYRVRVYVEQDGEIMP